MNRVTSARLALVAGLAFFGSVLAQDQGYLLISEEEFLASEAAPEEEEFERAVPDPYAPTIGIVRPFGGGPKYQAPIDIELSFEAAEDAEIDLDTLKITYGALRLDVTDRVTEHATVTSEGLVSENAEMPKGKHKLTISIADTEGRVGKKQFKFQIVK